MIRSRRLLAASAVSILCGCGGPVSLGTGAGSTMGAATSLGGATAVVTQGSGGNAVGGTLASGGVAASGSSGGSVATGGVVNNGGTTASKSSTAMGGVTATGGTLATGGSKGTGGTRVANSGPSADATTCSGTDADCVIRVAKTGNDANSGSSWAAALASVQEGLDAASALIAETVCCNVEVWVAAGTYMPTGMTDATDARMATFQLVANVGLFGGFAGTESLRNDRNIAANVTVLSGDIGTPGDPSDNTYHVVTGVTGATLDGFTITGGNANGDSSIHTDMGGGMYNSNASPTVTHCTFTRNNANRGAAACNYTRSSPTMSNCTFTNNTGDSALWNLTWSSPTIVNCLFANNSGEGIASTDSGSPTITNCTIVNNGGSGIFNSCAGMYCNRTPQPEVTNCIIWGNAVGATDGQIGDPIIVPENGGSTDPLTPRYYSSAKVTNSIVQGGYHGATDVITADPLFVDAANGDFRLSAGSPAIDAGNGCASYVTETDLAGNRRWDIGSIPNTGNGLDIGAFEYQGTAGVDPLITAFNCH